MIKVSSLNNERGSAAFYILLAIALLAALTYATSKGARFGSKALTDDQARLVAQEIIDFGNTMAAAVQKLRLRGCTPEQINFSGNGGVSKTSPGVAYDYTNINSPGDGSCNVFSENGGQVTARLLTSGFMDPALMTGSMFHPAGFYVSSARVLGVGSDDPANGNDLLFWQGRLKKEVCIAINNILGIKMTGPDPTVDAYNSNAPFNGTYLATANPIGDVATYLNGKTAFCNASVGDGKNYIFHQVLIAR